MRGRRSGHSVRCTAIVLACFVVLLPPVSSIAQQDRRLDENCTVSILNRTARVKPDGSWSIGSVPATGRARIRAVCRHGDTNVGGHSDFIEMTPFQFNGFDANIDLNDTVPIADGMTITLATTVLSEIGERLQLEVNAQLPEGGTRNVTAAETGTNYSSSNAAVAVVSEDGLVTAVMSGIAMISAANEGSLAIVRIIVALGGDSDGDGISDGLEVLLNMDPDNPADALEDFDFDGLTNAEEVALGTDIENDDTDFDGLADGDELDTGTDPLDGDSDDDGLIDGFETNPTDDDDGDDLINALDPDRDNDGLSDGVEDAIVGNPSDANPNSDNDTDGLTNIDEVDHGTDPTNRDTDADGLWDGSEVHGGCDPLVFDAPTIAIGRIVDSSDVPVPGAFVNGYAHRISSRVSIRSNDDGTFQLPGTAVCGGIQVSGRAFVDGRWLEGASIPVPVAAGNLTDIGDLVVIDQPGDQFDLPRFAMPQDSYIDLRHLMQSDFNGDGLLDLIAWRLDLPSGNRRAADELLTVFLGRPDRSFSPGIVTRVAERTVEFSDNRDDFDNVDWDTGDFNDDGHLDLVFTWRFENKAAIVPGRGDGSFSDSVRINGISDERAVGVGDFNEDDHDDIVFVFGGSQDAAKIYLGAGDATFTLGTSIPVGDDPNDVVVSDLNGDGHLDFVTANSDSDDISVLIGNGDGTFSTSATLLAGSHPDKVVIADADNDTLDDLIVLNLDSEDVSVFVGNGSGTYDTEIRNNADLEPEDDDPPRDLLVEELTGDGFADILVTTTNSSNLVPADAVLLRGTGGGNFAAELPSFPQSLRLREPIAIDLNDDSLADLVDISNAPDVLTAINLGNGAFLDHIRLGSDELHPSAFVRSDFDGDGIDDAAFIDVSAGSKVYIARHNNAQPDTFFLEQVLIADTLQPHMIAAGDFDGDNIQDLALARRVNNLTSSIWTARGLSPSSFEAPVLVAQQSSTREIRAIDYDNDGFVDLVGRTNFGLFLMNNLGDGNLTGPTEIIPPGLAGRPTDWLVLADIDEDDFTDFMVGGGNEGAIPDRFSVWTSDGDATIEETAVVDIPGFATGANGRRATGADFNNDGFVDIAIHNTRLQENALTGYFEGFVVLPGRGDGSFGEAILTPITPSERFRSGTDYVDHADFNNDGILDLIWADNSPYTRLMLGLGNGTFSSEHRYYLGGSVGSDALALDINGDLKADIIAARNGKAPALLLHR
jgi:hypothetical protein